MQSRERILTALNLGIPDKVPFADNIDGEIEVAIIGKEHYNKLEQAEAFGLDAMGYYGLLPPLFAVTKFVENREYLTEGLIKVEGDLNKVKFPDPEDESLYEGAKRFVEENGNSGYGLYATTRIGASGVLNSMGLDNFSFALFDNIKFVEKFLDRYVHWSAQVVEHINEIGFDFIWFYDDIAFKSGPMFSPQIFRELFLPRMKITANACKLPWIYHSDGNLMPVLDDLLTLGMNGLHPIEPGAMDIEEMKIKYGKRVCLIGNIDLRYTLTLGSEEDVEQEVKDRIEKIGKDGGYIISSSNTITKYCKVENVRAMIKSIEKFRDLNKRS